MMARFVDLPSTTLRFILCPGAGDKTLAIDRGVSTMPAVFRRTVGSAAVPRHVLSPCIECDGGWPEGIDSFNLAGRWRCLLIAVKDRSVSCEDMRRTARPLVPRSTAIGLAIAMGLCIMVVGE